MVCMCTYKYNVRINLKNVLESHVDTYVNPCQLLVLRAHNSTTQVIHTVYTHTVACQ